MWCGVRMTAPLKLFPKGSGSRPRRRGRRKAGCRACRASGFTLLEVLVALSIVSFAVIAHLSLQTENVRTVMALEEQALAQIVAENTLAEALGFVEDPVIGVLVGEETLGDRSWVWRRTTRATDNAQIVRIEITVRGKHHREGRVVAEIAGFRSTG